MRRRPAATAFAALLARSVRGGRGEERTCGPTSADRQRWPPLPGPFCSKAARLVGSERRRMAGQPGVPWVVPAGGARQTGRTPPSRPKRRPWGSARANRGGHTWPSPVPLFCFRQGSSETEPAVPEQ